MAGGGREATEAAHVRRSSLSCRRHGACLAGATVRAGGVRGARCGQVEARHQPRQVRARDLHEPSRCAYPASLALTSCALNLSLWDADVGFDGISPIIGFAYNVVNKVDCPHPRVTFISIVLSFFITGAILRA